jgi:hypothetical protein
LLAKCTHRRDIGFSKTWGFAQRLEKFSVSCFYLAMNKPKPKKKPPGRLKRPPRKTRAGVLLRTMREQKGLTLLDVEAATGLLGGGISHLENGRSIPTIKTAMILCAFYGLSLNKLAAAVAEDEL